MYLVSYMKKKKNYFIMPSINILIIHIIHRILLRLVVKLGILNILSNEYDSVQVKKLETRLLKPQYAILYVNDTNRDHAFKIIRWNSINRFC